MKSILLPCSLRIGAFAAVTAACLAVTGTTLASDRHGHGHAHTENPAAHVHGTGMLNVAIDGIEVAIELTLPGADVVGFEHAPETEEQKSAVADATAKLENGGNLFSFPPNAQCRLHSAAAETTSAHGHDHARRHDHGHAHSHGRGHDHTGNRHGAADGAQAEHSEFVARYRFACTRADAARHVDVRLFEAFPSLHELEAQTIGPSRQGAVRLTPGNTRLPL